MPIPDREDHRVATPCREPTGLDLSAAHDQIATPLGLTVDVIEGKVLKRCLCALGSLVLLLLLLHSELGIIGSLSCLLGIDTALFGIMAVRGLREPLAELRNQLPTTPEEGTDLAFVATGSDPTGDRLAHRGGTIEKRSGNIECTF